MYTYGTTIAIILVCEIGAAVALMIFKSDVVTVIETGLLEGLDGYGLEPNVTVSGHAATTQSWDELQRSMKCCGVVDYNDWHKNMNLNATNSVPDSCCKELSEGCGAGKLIPGSLDVIYTDGCLNKIIVTIKDNIIWVALAAGCIVAIQVVIVCVACCLGNTMKKAQYEKK